MTAPASKSVCDGRAQKMSLDTDQSVPGKGRQEKAAELGHSRCGGVSSGTENLIAWRTVTRGERARLNCCLSLGKGAEEQGSLCKILFPATAMDGILVLVVHFLHCLLWKTPKKQRQEPSVCHSEPKLCWAGASFV